jgi:hypothetical protein
VPNGVSHFIAAANPQTVLALIGEIEALKHDLRGYMNAASAEASLADEFKRELEEARNNYIQAIQDFIDSHKRDVGGECDEGCDIVLGMESARDVVAKYPEKL